MAVSILTGSLSTIEATFGGTSVKCGFGRMATNFVRGATDQTTFCSGKWVEEQPGRIQMMLSLIGYATKGAAWSDPLVWIGSATPVAFVGTADTSCTVSGSVNCFGDSMDLVAAANSGRTVDFRSTGAVTTAWVTT